MIGRRLLMAVLLAGLGGACGYLGRPAIEGPGADAPGPLGPPAAVAGPGGPAALQVTRLDVVDPASGQPAASIQVENGSAVILVKVRHRWKRIDLGEAAGRLGWAPPAAGGVEVLDLPPREVPPE